MPQATENYRRTICACFIGYMVQEGDTLWTIAKRYFTSIDSIRKVNQLERDELSPGQKLVIVKG